MSAWPAGGYPGPPPPSPPKAPPSAAWYWIGALVLVGGIGAGIAIIATGFSGAFTRPTPVTEAGTTIEAQGGESWTIWSTGSDSGFGVGNPPPCTVGGPGGEPFVAASFASTTLTLGSTTYQGVGTFRTDRAGTYTVRCDAALAVGPELDVFGTVGRTFGGVGLILFGLIAGIAILVTAGVLRSSRRRRAAQTAGGWPGYAHQGYGQAGYGQAGYGQPEQGQPPWPTG